MKIEQTKFPQVYRNIPLKDLLLAFEQGASRVNSVIKGLSQEELLARPRPGKWSIQEIAFHMVDSEIMGSVRIRQTFAQPGSLFAVYDQDVWARVFDYQHKGRRDLRSSLELFKALRDVTSGIFRTASEADWHKTGVHPEHGEVTLRNLLELYADHSERHIQQILEIRGLINRPLEFPLILPERLY